MQQAWLRHPVEVFLAAAADRPPRDNAPHIDARVLLVHARCLGSVES
jgi:hypothetical protein